MNYVIHFLGYGFLGLIVASTAGLLGMAVCDCVTSLTTKPLPLKTVKTAVAVEEESKPIDTTEADAAEVALITQLVESTADLSGEEDEEKTEESDVANE